MELQQQQAAEQRIEFMQPTPLADAELPDRPNVAEVSEWIRKSPNTIYQWARKGLIPCKRVGRSYIFDKAALLKWARPEEAA